MVRALVALLVATLASVLAQPCEAEQAFHYQLFKSVTLGGSDLWDYLTFDPQSRRLFITRDTHVVVVDGDSGALIGDIANLGHVHGVALAAERGYISDSGTNSVVVFDRQSLRRLGAIAAGMRPDGILYDAFSRRVFSLNGGSRDATAIDVATGRVVGTVPLGGRPEAAASDQQGTIYVNIADRGEIAAFDSKTLQVQHRWSLAPCSDPSGMALDAAHERVFSGCRNTILAVSDGRAGKVVATVPIGQGVDANGFDPTYGLVFSSNGVSGTLTVIRERTPNDYEVLENVPTARSARTMALDPSTHRVYLVAADVKILAPPAMPAPPAAPGPRRRFSIEPGSFRVLTFVPASGTSAP
jgi:DNA-binding beta-propeller fold protein YncE